MNRIYLDIETSVPRDWAVPPISDDDLNEGVQERFKPDTVATYQERNRAKWVETATKRACLDWRLGRIVAIGWAVDDRPPHVNMNPDEANMLAHFWADLACFEHATIVGFNHLRFDLPWLKGRSAVLGVKSSRIFATNRYATQAICDWSDILSSFGQSDLRGWTLAKYAELFQLEHRPKGEGKDVPQWYREGESDAIRAHLTGDLLALRDLDVRCRSSFLGEFERGS